MFQKFQETDRASCERSKFTNNYSIFKVIPGLKAISYILTLTRIVFNITVCSNTNIRSAVNLFIHVAFMAAF